MPHSRAFSSNSIRRRRAIQIAHRRRRDSLRARPKIHQTRILDRDLTPIPLTDAFPSGQGSRPVTFQLDLQITAQDPSGTILNVGDSDPALTVYYQNGVIHAIAGSGSSSADAVDAIATREHQPGPGGEPALYQIVVAVRPGDGHLRIWDEHGLLAQGEATSGSISAWSGETANDLIVTYAAAAGYNSLIADPGAPAGFEARNLSRGYALYLPQHFLTDIPDDVTFDEFLFRATYINNQLALYPLLDDSE